MEAPCRRQRPDTNRRTHLEGAFLPGLSAETLQDLAVDSQAQDLRCDLVVVRHCVSPELQLTAGWCEELGQAVVSTGWTSSLLLLVLVHFDLLFFFSSSKIVLRLRGIHCFPKNRCGAVLIRWFTGIPSYPVEHLNGEYKKMKPRAAVKRPPLY